MPTPSLRFLTILGVAFLVLAAVTTRAADPLSDATSGVAASLTVQATIIESETHRATTTAVDYTPAAGTASFFGDHTRTAAALWVNRGPPPCIKTNITITYIDTTEGKLFGTVRGTDGGGITTDVWVSKRAANDTSRYAPKSVKVGTTPNGAIRVGVGPLEPGMNLGIFTSEKRVENFATYCSAYTTIVVPGGPAPQNCMSVGTSDLTYRDWLMAKGVNPDCLTPEQVTNLWGEYTGRGPGTVATRIPASINLALHVGGEMTTKNMSDILVKARGTLKTPTSSANVQHMNGLLVNAKGGHFGGTWFSWAIPSSDLQTGKTTITVEVTAEGVDLSGEPRSAAATLTLTLNMDVQGKVTLTTKPSTMSLVLGTPQGTLITTTTLRPHDP